jgi:hypothetical protein
MVLNAELRFSFETDCIDFPLNDGFTIRTICSVHLGGGLLLQTISTGTTRDASFRRMLDRFGDQPTRDLIEVQRAYAYDLAMAQLKEIFG